MGPESLHADGEQIPTKEVEGRGEEGDCVLVEESERPRVRIPCRVSKRGQSCVDEFSLNPPDDPDVRQGDRWDVAAVARDPARVTTVVLGRRREPGTPDEGS